MENTRSNHLKRKVLWKVKNDPFVASRSCFVKLSGSKFETNLLLVNDSFKQIWFNQEE